MDDVNRKIRNKKTICSLNGLVKKLYKLVIVNRVFIEYKKVI